VDGVQLDADQHAVLAHALAQRVANLRRRTRGGALITGYAVRGPAFGVIRDRHGLVRHGVQHSTRTLSARHKPGVTSMRCAPAHDELPRFLDAAGST